MNNHKTYHPFSIKHFKFVVFIFVLSFSAIHITSLLSEVISKNHVEVNWFDNSESEQNETNEEIQEDEIFHNSVFALNKLHTNIETGLYVSEVYKSPYSPLYTPPPEV